MNKFRISLFLNIFLWIAFCYPFYETRFNYSILYNQNVLHPYLITEQKREPHKTTPLFLSYLEEIQENNPESSLNMPALSNLWSEFCTILTLQDDQKILESLTRFQEKTEKDLPQYPQETQLFITAHLLFPLYFELYKNTYTPQKQRIYFQKVMRRWELLPPHYKYNPYVLNKVLQFNVDIFITKIQFFIPFHLNARTDIHIHITGDLKENIAIHLQSLREIYQYLQQQHLYYNLNLYQLFRIYEASFYFFSEGPSAIHTCMDGFPFLIQNPNILNDNDIATLLFYLLFAHRETLKQTHSPHAQYLTHLDRYIQNVINLIQDPFTKHYFIAYTHARMHEYSKALTSLSQALGEYKPQEHTRYPSLQSAYHLRGYCLMKLGRKHDAKIALQEFIASSDPENNAFFIGLYERGLPSKDIPSLRNLLLQELKESPLKEKAAGLAAALISYAPAQKDYILTYLPYKESIQEYEEGLEKALQNDHENIAFLLDIPGLTIRHLKEGYELLTNHQTSSFSTLPSEKTTAARQWLRQYSRAFVHTFLLSAIKHKDDYASEIAEFLFYFMPDTLEHVLYPLLEEIKNYFDNFLPQPTAYETFYYLSAQIIFHLYENTQGSPENSDLFIKLFTESETHYQQLTHSTLHTRNDQDIYCIFKTLIYLMHLFLEKGDLTNAEVTMKKIQNHPSYTQLCNCAEEYWLWNCLLIKFNLTKAILFKKSEDISGLSKKAFLQIQTQEEVYRTTLRLCPFHEAVLFDLKMQYALLSETWKRGAEQIPPYSGKWYDSINPLTAGIILFRHGTSVKKYGEKEYYLSEATHYTSTIPWMSAYFGITAGTHCAQKDPLALSKSAHALEQTPCLSFLYALLHIQQPAVALDYLAHAFASENKSNHNSLVNSLSVWKTQIYMIDSLLKPYVDLETLYDSIVQLAFTSPLPIVFTRAVEFLFTKGTDRQKRTLCTYLEKKLFPEIIKGNPSAQIRTQYLQLLPLFIEYKKQEAQRQNTSQENIPTPWFSCILQRLQSPISADEIEILIPFAVQIPRYSMEQYITSTPLSDYSPFSTLCTACAGRYHELKQSALEKEWRSLSKWISDFAEQKQIILQLFLNPIPQPSQIQKQIQIFCTRFPGTNTLMEPYLAATEMLIAFTHEEYNKAESILSFLSKNPTLKPIYDVNKMRWEEIQKRLEEACLAYASIKQRWDTHSITAQSFLCTLKNIAKRLIKNPDKIQNLIMFGEKYSLVYAHIKAEISELEQIVALPASFSALLTQKDTLHAAITLRQLIAKDPTYSKIPSFCIELIRTEYLHLREHYISSFLTEEIYPDIEHLLSSLQEFMPLIESQKIHSEKRTSAPKEQLHLLYALCTTYRVVWKEIIPALHITGLLAQAEQTRDHQYEKFDEKQDKKRCPYFHQRPAIPCTLTHITQDGFAATLNIDETPYQLFHHTEAVKLLWREKGSDHPLKEVTGCIFKSKRMHGERIIYFSIPKIFHHRKKLYIFPIHKILRSKNTVEVFLQRIPDNTLADKNQSVQSVFHFCRNIITRIFSILDTLDTDSQSLSTATPFFSLVQEAAATQEIKNALFYTELLGIRTTPDTHSLSCSKEKTSLPHFQNAEQSLQPIISYLHSDHPLESSAQIITQLITTKHSLHSSQGSIIGIFALNHTMAQKIGRLLEQGGMNDFIYLGHRGDKLDPDMKQSHWDSLHRTKLLEQAAKKLATGKPVVYLTTHRGIENDDIIQERSHRISVSQDASLANPKNGGFDIIIVPYADLLYFSDFLSIGKHLAYGGRVVLLTNGSWHPSNIGIPQDMLQWIRTFLGKQQKQAICVLTLEDMRLLSFPHIHLSDARIIDYNTPYLQKIQPFFTHNVDLAKDIGITTTIETAA